MEEADRVLARLARIERLQPGEASAVLLLGELRALVREAEDWARTEGDARAHLAASKLRAVSKLRESNLRESKLEEGAAGMR